MVNSQRFKQDSMVISSWFMMKKQYQTNAADVLNRLGLLNWDCWTGTSAELVFSKNMFFFWTSSMLFSNNLHMLERFHFWLNTCHCLEGDYFITISEFRTKRTAIKDPWKSLPQQSVRLNGPHGPPLVPENRARPRLLAVSEWRKIERSVQNHSQTLATAWGCSWCSFNGQNSKIIVLDVSSCNYDDRYRTYSMEVHSKKLPSHP